MRSLNDAGDRALKTGLGPKKQLLSERRMCSDEFAFYQLWCRVQNEPMGDYVVEDLENEGEDLGEDDVPLSEDYTIMEELVNLTAIQQWMDMIGSRT